MGNPIMFIVAKVANETTGSTKATIAAARTPKVMNKTETTSATPMAMLIPTSDKRSVVYWL